ncbi:MAG: hypothetical protein ACYDEA_11860, partial [Candidatus Dormibacteria bacterium]
MTAPTERRLVGGLLVAATRAREDTGRALADALAPLRAEHFQDAEPRRIVEGLKGLLRDGRLASVAGKAGQLANLARELGVAEAKLDKLAGSGIPSADLMEAARAFAQAAEARARRRDGPGGAAGSASAEPGWRAASYFMDPERGTFRDPEGGEPRRLANFTAVITRKSSDDDGDPDAERTSGEELQAVRLRLEIRQRKRKVLLEVTAAEFPGMRWPARVTGIDLSVSAGTVVKDQFREAIELISIARAGEASEGGDGQIPRSTRYVHTGWTKLNGDLIYLHAGGGIGAGGSRDDIEVSLAPELRGHRLSAPPEGDGLREAVRASLALLDLGPPRLMVPLLGAAYRAPLGAADFTLHLHGASGRFKTEVAKLALAHFQECQDSRELGPISWHSTDNAIEALLHQIKDSVAVLDDLLPAGLDDGERRRQLSTAARVFRAQGNQGGRSRLRSDTSGRPPKAPRGLAISTGEELPRGLSGIARAWLIEQKDGDVVSARLTAAQEAAPLYSRAMSGYAQWLAPQMPEMPERIRRERVRLRAGYTAPHSRTSEIAAHLELGCKAWLEFAVACGAIDDARATEVADIVRAALQDGCKDQIEEQGEADPVELFREGLSSAISAGKSYVQGIDGRPPEPPDSWGYSQREGRDGGIEWEPDNRQGRIGWLVGEGLYLEPAAAYKAANAQLDGGLGIGQVALTKRLRDRGVLMAVGGSRHIPVMPPRSVGDHRPRCLHLDPLFLVAPVAPVAPERKIDSESSSNGA